MTRPGRTDSWLDEAVRALQRYAARGGPATSSPLGTGAVADLEHEMCRWSGRRHALALPSGTAALYLALRVVGVQAGDEVVLPSCDWGAALAAVLQLGGVPVFADVVLPDCTVEAASVRALLSPRARAMVATHLGGVPADMPAVLAACTPRGIPVIEDCSQALGATLDGIPVGTLGTVAVASFAGKIIDAGEGGILLTDDPDLWRAAVQLSQHPARQTLSGISNPDHAAFGMRMHPLAAVLALEGLRTIGERLAARRTHLERLLDLLVQTEGATLPAVVGRASFTGRTLPIRTTCRARSALGQAGVELRLADYASVGGPTVTGLPAGRSGRIPLRVVHAWLPTLGRCSFRPETLAHIDAEAELREVPTLLTAGDDHQTRGRTVTPRPET